MKKVIQLLLLSITMSLLASCSDTKADDASKLVENRWYTSVQVDDGQKVFETNCAVCHGKQAQGLVAEWRKTLPDGKYPAPPLNGSAHAWHHSKAVLLRSINNGGIPLGGTMPAFEKQLSEAEKEAVLAYIMSLWTDKIYNIWCERNPLPQ